ncbi:PAS domain S-box protein [uncultured Methanomethylovorans sp.]|uniref:PAS domain S-box protein n=1 Tax=uncultured Methanomethylovorans sp. TaxID=183759 RepID=UPI002AA5F94D|nr:PAS domain S-box protein [uncultured Methanomethylovorans sp.]
MASKNTAVPNKKFEISSLDFWADGIVILSPDGVICYSNKSWNEFSQNNGLDDLGCCEGSNYLKLCAEFASKESESAGIVQGIKDVMEGRLKVFKFESQFFGTDGKKYLLVKVDPLSQDYPTNVILQHVDITERKKVEPEILEFDQFLKTILNNIHLAGVILDSSANIIFCNDFLLDRTGWKREDVFGKNWFDVFLPKETISEIKTVFLRTTENAGFPSYHENEIITRDGNKRIIIWNNTVLKDRNGNISSIISIGEDITELKLAGRSLLNSKGQLRTLVDTIQDPIWLKDQNGFYLMCNSKFERFFGAKEADIIGKTDYDFVDPELADLFTLNDRKTIATGKSTMNEEEITYADDGHREYLETIKSPMYDSNGHLIGVLGVGRDITQRKQVDEELQRREMQLRAAQKLGGFGSWEIDLDSGKVDASEESITIYGLEGKQLTIGVIQNAPLPDFRLMLDEKLRDLLERKSPYDVYFRIKRQNDGAIRDVHSIAEYFSERNVVIGMLQDITELKQVQDKVAEEAVRRRILFDQSMDGLVVLDQNGKVFEANQKYAEMLGYSSEEIQELHMWDWDTHYTREQLLEMIKLADSKGVLHETKHRRKDGSFIDVEISGNAAMFGDKKFIFCVCRDITERKQAEDILIHAKMAAEDANKSKGEFLATMSHELRTPLNSIIGFSDMMLGGTTGTLNEKQIRYMNHISKGGKHLLELINDILDLSKIEAGKMELYRELFSVCDAVYEIISLLSPIAIKKEIELDLKMDTELPYINADKTKFKQILYNLVSNAIKFTPIKGYVSISAQRIDNMLEISVTDTGVGIASKDLHKLFQPFKQLNSYLTREYEGTGLGLVLVKKFVELHGGSVWVESEVGKGSIFTFTIPYC